MVSEKQQAESAQGWPDCCNTCVILRPEIAQQCRTIMLNHDNPLNPQALRLEDVTRILSASGERLVTGEMIDVDVGDRRTR